MQEKQIFIDSEMNDYFNTLSPVVKEIIVQSAGNITNLEQLKKLAEGFEAK